MRERARVSARFRDDDVGGLAGFRRHASREVDARADRFTAAAGDWVDDDGDHGKRAKDTKDTKDTKGNAQQLS